ncbi:uncharacterized protein SPPG_03797 [Spizellomyces punctatus DAOM BR117]|uniref:Uncharacterized protein n=1 Tax=Spizellomyces punctatus (strain DAOM BR117) TaxID=645134 RepID=A0A0L0HIM1_SPIPD|nr:uncharacterized protein SPPG_03797 [Spizellomyces punctatus DAOM BR117]KND00674.1 hypothetical protein SPPG_03797 [Spizellomyces punctatus DAOM BR117]|eukprot:XP_016608713.1 hypothetical protein SPPG_03797 [Spizellomyces punctatus DAOM BR117]
MTLGQSRPGSDQAFPRLDSRHDTRVEKRQSTIMHKEFEAIFGKVAWEQKSPELVKRNVIQKKHVLIEFGDKEWDLDELKQAALDKTSLTTVTRSVRRILSSALLDEFLVNGALYARWNVWTLILEKSRTTHRLGALQNPRAVGLGPIARHPLFNDETLTLPQAQATRTTTLKAFSLSYCFLLLFISTHSSSPAKERLHFELVYTLAKEIIPTLLSIPSHTPMIEQDLDRLFRGGLFCGESVGVVEDAEDHYVARLLSGGLEKVLKSRPPSSRRSVVRPTSSSPRSHYSLPKHAWTAASTKSTNSDTPKDDTIDPSPPPQRRTPSKRKISLNAVRMARSPLADSVLPPPQRFLFVQTRGRGESLVGV